MDKELLIKTLDKYAEKKLKKYPRRFIEDVKKAFRKILERQLARGEKFNIKIFDRKAKQQGVQFLNNERQKEKTQERSL